jgi:hypothetical protein
MRNEVRKGSPKPIQFPDNESVARTEGSKGPAVRALAAYSWA